MQLQTQYNDNHLLSLLKDDNIDGFDLLFDRYSQPLYQFGFSHLKISQDAEEIVQEVFYRLWECRKKIPENVYFKSYLFGIAYHVIMDFFRKRLNDHKYEDYLRSKAIPECNEIQEAMEYSELNGQLNNIIEKLPLRRKEIYNLSRQEGLSHKEIALKLNITPKTVENHINLALRYIRKMLGEESYG